VQEPRWKRTAYWRNLPRWKKALLDEGAEEAFILRYFADRIEKLEDFHLRLIDTALNKPAGLILYPAGHGKTTLTGTVLPLLMLSRWPDARILIIAKNDEEAIGISHLLQREMVDNTDLIHDFGPFKPSPESDKPWSLSRMEVANRTIRSKTPSLLIVGQGAKTILGTRTDWTICDDVVTNENSATVTQRVKMRDWFDLQVETGPEFADSRLTVIGTRFDPHDLYGDLWEMQEADEDGKKLVQIWERQREDAVVSEENHQTLWPAVWPWKRLMQKKVKIGTLSFNKRYRNIAVDASRMVVKEEYITGGWRGNTNYPGCLDRNHKIGDFADNWEIVAGFDPAVGGTRNAKFCAHLTVALGACKEHEKCLWVVDIDRNQMTLPQQVEMILEKHKHYGLRKSIVEANSYQMGLYQAIEQKMEERHELFTVEPHYTNRSNKQDPELGVQAMAPWFERGWVHIPWGDALSQRKMQDFIDELVQFPDGRTSDTVMAFWFAWLNLQTSAPRYESFNRLDTTRSAWAGRPKFGTRVIQNPYWVKD
jgi:hypothetical protein